MFVYFIGPKDWRVGRVKIGVTSGDPRSRLASFQTGSPYPLELYAYVPGDYNFEHMLHETFAPLRLHGEWFRMDGRLLALMGNMVGEKLGRMAHTQIEFFNAISLVIENDDPIHPLFCSPEEWVGSTIYEPIEQWLSNMQYDEYMRWRESELACQ